MGSTCSSIDCVEICRYEPTTTNRPLVVMSPSGCDKLATIEENLIMAFIPLGTSDETRLTIVLNRAYQVCFHVTATMAVSD